MIKMLLLCFIRSENHGPAVLVQDPHPEAGAFHELCLVLHGEGRVDVEEDVLRQGAPRPGAGQPLPAQVLSLIHISRAHET